MVTIIYNQQLWKLIINGVFNFENYNLQSQNNYCES